MSARVGVSGSIEALHFLVRPDAALSPRRATHFLLLRQEKVSKEKASRSHGPSASLRGSLRCSRQAGSSSNSLRCTSLKQSLALIRLPLRCSALPHGVGMGSGAKANTDSESGIFGVRAQIRHAFGAPCGCCAAKLRSDPKNQVARRFLKCFRPVDPIKRA